MSWSFSTGSSPRLSAVMFPENRSFVNEVERGGVDIKENDRLVGIDR